MGQLSHCSFCILAAIMCGDIPDPVNGQIVFVPDVVAPFAHQTMATYSCSSELMLEDGINPRVCEGDGSTNVGEWSGAHLQCIGKHTQVHVHLFIHAQ